MFVEFTQGSPWHLVWPVALSTHAAAAACTAVAALHGPIAAAATARRTAIATGLCTIGATTVAATGCVPTCCTLHPAALIVCHGTVATAGSIPIPAGHAAVLQVSPAA